MDTLYPPYVVERLRQAASRPIVRCIAEALGGGGALHLVGGTVRDVFAGVEEYDIDLAIGLRPQQAKTRLEIAGLRVIETGVQHGTLTVVGDDGEQAELTTFRRPGPRESEDYSNSIEEDLSGRDFTINAMAYDLEGDKLLDPFGGRSDLERGVVRAVADPAERFREDPLRLLRAVRFGPAQGRTIEPGTFSAAKAAASLISRTSAERVRTELERIVTAPGAAAAFRAMAALGLLQPILPEMLPAIGCEQNEFHIHDVFDHTLWVMERCPPDKLLRFAALFHDLGKPHTLTTDEAGRRHFYRHEDVSTETCKKVMKRLRFSNEEIKKTSTLVRYHMRPLTCGAPGVRRLMRDLGEHLDDWLAFKKADSPPVFTQKDFDAQYNNFVELLEQERARRAGPPFGKLAVNGDDLIQLGMRPGRELGVVLKRLEELVLDAPELNDRGVLLAKANEFRGSGEL